MIKRGQKAEEKNKKFNWRKLLVFIICLILVFLIGFISSIFTSNETNSEWYNSIKSPLTPPNFIFPIVWNILFLMISISMYFAWSKSKKQEKLNVASLFAINLFVNFLWSILFFKLHDPITALIDLFLIWLSILALIFGLWKISKISSYLLIPYFLWVSFAGILNFLAI